MLSNGDGSRGEGWWLDTIARIILFLFCSILILSSFGVLESYWKIVEISATSIPHLSEISEFFSKMLTKIGTKLEIILTSFGVIPAALLVYLRPTTRIMRMLICTLLVLSFITVVGYFARMIPDGVEDILFPSAASNITSDNAYLIISSGQQSYNLFGVEPINTNDRSERLAELQKQIRQYPVSIRCREKKLYQCSMVAKNREGQMIDEKDLATIAIRLNVVKAVVREYR